MKPTQQALLFMSAAIVTFSSTPTIADNHRRSMPIRGGYWNGATYPPSDIETSYFTHLFYAFVNPSPTTFALNVTPEDAPLLAHFASSLRTSRPPAKSLISIAGDSDVIAGIAANPSHRRTFIHSTIATARKYGVDGLDLDYEFPKTQKEMSDLAGLFKLWHAEIIKEARRTNKPPLLLTAAVYFSSTFFLSNGNTYPIAAIVENLDWINVMCYDYHGSWNTSKTGLHAALYDPTSRISTSYGISSWINAGVPARKVIMGLPVYGRSWKLKDPAEHGVEAPAVGLGPSDSSGNGTMVYKKVVEFNKENGATEVFDEERVAAYSFVGTSWIGYDSPASTAAKVEFAKEQGLGGYFFWAIGYDNDWAISRRAFQSWKN